MTFDARVHAVKALGFTDRHARFLVTVALHGGHCLRRQYEAFSGIRYGKNTRAFFDELVGHGFAERVGGRADRGHIYHLHSRTLYGAVGQPESRNRLVASRPQIARRLMLLDAVIQRRDFAWFATTQDKLDLFVSRFGVPAHVLTRRTAATEPESRPGQYFSSRHPIFLSQDGVPHFVYLATDGGEAPFAAFLRAYAMLLRCLCRWGVLVVGMTSWPGLQSVFEAFTASLHATVGFADDELQWYFERRRLVDAGDLAQVSVFDLRRFRTLRQRFDLPAHEQLYTEWLTSGRIGVTTPGSPTGDSIGTLITDVLPFAYEQFGSLPGVA